MTSDTSTSSPFDPLSPTCSHSVVASTLPTPTVYMERQENVKSVVAYTSPTPHPRIPTGPSGMHSSSRTWISPLQLAKQQRQREEKTARYIQPAAQPPIHSQAIEDFEALKANWDRCFPCNDWLLPQTLNGWIQHQRFMIASQERLLERKRLCIQQKLEAIARAKAQGLYLPEMKAIGGKAWKFGPLRSSVLSKFTIWTKDSQPQLPDASHWPSAKEYKYEGEDRHATKDASYRHFLPLPRDWREELRVVHTANAGQNYKYWEEFPRHHIFRFDYLTSDHPPTHLEIYPFSIGCPLPDCTDCWNYRKSYGLLNSATFLKTVDDYLLDTAAENMEHLLVADLLVELNGPVL